jgi:hydroxypyruvate isomerase
MGKMGRHMPTLNRRHALMAAAVAAAPLRAAAAPRRARDIAEVLKPFACNLDTWFRDLPFGQRFAEARKAGFTVIEFWRADRPDGLDAPAIRKLCDANGLTVAQFAPVWPEFGDPAKHPDLLKTTERAIADARILGCTRFTVTGHHDIKDMTREAMLASYQSGLMRIAPLLEAAQMTALVEPFNRVNHVGHFLNGSQPAVPMIRAVNSPCVKMLWDFYHMQLEDGDLIEKFTAAADCAAYVQIGDVPGRHQPGTGEVNHANLIRAVRAAGYRDVIGLEFMPLDENVAAAVEAMLTL